MDDATTQNDYELSLDGAETATPLPTRAALSTPGLSPRVVARAPSGAEDPLDALETLTEMRTRVALLIDEHAVRALRAGRSYGDIARALGVSRQAAHRRYREAAAPRVVATAQTRRLLRVAREEAVRARAPALGSEHLLVAALHCGGDAAEALADVGVTLQRARTYASDVTSDRAGSECLAFGLRAVLREAAGTVAARGGRWLDVNTLLLAALSDPEEGACRVLTALAIDPGSVQQRVEASRRPCTGSDRGAT